MYRNTDEAKQANIEKMGEPLGVVYSALWQEVSLMHLEWTEYVELFGTKRERVMLLNETAPLFFRMLQDGLWELSLLHLARVTDPVSSPGRQGRSNLTVRALPPLISDARLKEDVTKLVNEAIEHTAFCRDWRNRHIAHRDLKLALERPTTPLAEGSRAQVSMALKAVAAILNALDWHYSQSETTFDPGASHGGALSLLYAIGIGSRARAARAKRLEEGNPSQEDLGGWDV
jgi:hypothetical protein